MKLIKYSHPGWEKEFSDVESLKSELFAHICGLCQSGCEMEPGVNGTSSLSELLSTACGCEYAVEE